MNGKVPSLCGVGLVFYIKHMTLENVHNPIFGLSNISDITPVAFQALNKIIGLAGASDHAIISLIALYIFNSPWMGETTAIICICVVCYTP